MKPPKKVVIFGAGGHGKVLLDILLESGIEVLGFIDEDLKKKGERIFGFEILGDWSFFWGHDHEGVVLGIGNNVMREKIFRLAKDQGIAVQSAIHPRSIVSRHVTIGEGVVIMPGAVVNAGCVLGDGVVVNTGASVDHDCLLERFCQIWPGAHLAGSVRVGEFAYIGTGASVIQNITIGRNSMVGAGAAVISDVPSCQTVVGVPAKAIKRKDHAQKNIK